MSSRSLVGALSAVVLGIAGCSASEVTEPVLLDKVDRIELHAWRETLGPSYPLTITGQDSIATVVAFFAPDNAAWRDASEFPGMPILAAFYSATQLRGEFGFVERSHQQGGYLVNRVATRIRVRSATASDIARFLAFFDLHVEIREP